MSRSRSAAANQRIKLTGAAILVFARHEGLAGGPGSLYLSLLLELARMNISLITTLILLACVSQIKSSAVAGDDGDQKEPPLQFTVCIGEKKIRLAEGESGEFLGTFVNPKVSIEIDPNRTFPYEGIRFEYPRTFNFEAQSQEPGVKFWTLAGNDLKIFYRTSVEEVTPLKFAESLIFNVGRSKAEIIDQNATATFGKNKLAGVVVRLSFGPRTILYRIYSLPKLNNRSRILGLQDSVGANDIPSSEYDVAMKVFSRSLIIESNDNRTVNETQKKDK